MTKNISPALLSLLCGGLTLAVAAPARAEEVPQYGAMIPRTMQLLETSPQARRVPVRILFYGQSITAQKWSAAVGEELKKRYPNAEVSITNLSIGGVSAERLIKVAEHDLYPFYPDLVYFQDYGGYMPGKVYKEGELDEIIANIRRKTSAEIVIATHHVRASQAHDEAKDEKNNQSDEEASEKIREIAKKYGCELADIRNEWKQYLAGHNLPPLQFLKDDIHLNDEGCELMKELVLKHFHRVPGAVNPWSNSVTSQPVRAAADGSIELEFTGNRVDAVAAPLDNGQKPGTAKVLIDGVAPSALPELYTFSRPSSTKIMWFPTIYRIENEKPLILEEWKARIDKFNDDKGKDFDFTVIGSQTGEDGSGNSLRRFVSNSGRVVLDPANEWSVAGAMAYSKKTLEPGFEFNWKVLLNGVDTYVQPGGADPAKVNVFVLAQGLTNGKHTLKIIPNRDGAVRIQSLTVHTPPLK